MSDNPLRLVRPCVAYRASYLAGVQESLAEGVTPAWNPDKMRDRFEEFVETLLAKETDTVAGWSPETVFWSVVNEEFVGQITLRHTLAGNLLWYGGHIGYDIRPSLRRHGYGTQQLALCLHEARARGFGRVLITCDDTNTASARIIEANSGVLENRVDNGRPSLTRRYWITL